MQMAPEVILGNPYNAKADSYRYAEVDYIIIIFKTLVICCAEYDEKRGTDYLLINIYY